MAQERLHKIMANAGVASRRACEEMIQAGRVTVNGQVVTELGVKADAERDQIRVDGDLLKPRAAERRSYLMLYKPAGVLSVFDDPRGRPGLESLLKGPVRLYPVGRLDLDSEGLLLLTDDGDLTLKLSHPRYEHAKSYLVLVDRMPGTDTLAHFRRGIQLDDGMTAPSQWRVLEHPAMVPSPDDPAADEGVWLHVTMHEGRKRQIRRMAAAERLQVRRLVRVGMGSLRLDRKLRPGESRPLTRREMQQLLSEVEGAELAPVARRRDKGEEPAPRARGDRPASLGVVARSATARPQGRASGARREGQPERGPGRRSSYAGGPTAGPRPSGARPSGPRRADQPEREPGRRPPDAGGPKPGPRPSGPRPDGPRRADQSEREPGRRPPYAGGPQPGPRPSGPRPAGPRRADQSEREPGRRPPYAGGPKPGPRPSGPRPGGPRRADQPEREPGRRPSYAGGAKPGPRPSGPRPAGPRRADQPEREPGRRAPYAGGPKPGSRPGGPRRADQPEREPGRRAPYAGGPKPEPRSLGPRASSPRAVGAKPKGRPDAPSRADQPERVPRRGPSSGKPRPGGGPQRPRRPGEQGTRRPSGRPARPPRPGARKTRKS